MTRIFSENLSRIFQRDHTSADEAIKPPIYGGRFWYGGIGLVLFCILGNFAEQVSAVLFAAPGAGVFAAIH